METGAEGLGISDSSGIHGEIFRIADECVSVGLRVAVLVLRNVTIGDAAPALRDEIRGAGRRLRQRFPTAADVRQTECLHAFRRVYRALGVNPSVEVPGCQRLVELAWRREDLPRINTLVDIYNLVSVESMLSIGAHDLAAVDLPILLGIAKSGQPFTGLHAIGGGFVKRGEFAYFDAQERVICRLDVVQAEFSRITRQTVTALVILEGTSTHAETSFTQARDRLIALAAEYCGATAEVGVWPF